MKHYLLSLISLTFFNVALPAQSIKTLPLAQNPLMQQSNSELYAQALIALANNRKEEAAQIAQVLKNASSNCKTIQFLFDKMLLLYLLNDPQQLTELGLLESVGLNDHNKELNDVSVTKKIDLIDQKKALLAEFMAWNISELTQEQKLTYKIFIDKLQHDIDEEPFVLHQYTLTHWLDSILPKLNMLFTRFHAIKTNEDAQNYLIRLNSVARLVDQLIERMQLQKMYGIIAPRFTLEKVIGLIETLMPKDINTHLYFTYLNTKLNEHKIANTQCILSQSTIILETSVYPAFQKLKYYLQSILPCAQNNGLWALPDGDAYYAYLLKENTTTDLTSDQIHELGLKEVELMQQEIRKVLAQEGIANPEMDINSLLKQFAPEQKLYANSEEGRKECIADYYKILERSRNELGNLFDIKPKQVLCIERMPAHEESGGLCAYYYWPSFDGTRKGTFFVNLKNSPSNKNFGMETLTIHEGEPGHHLQLSLQYEMDIPLLHKTALYLGYIEGWGLYCERLAYEHNFYSSAASKIAALQLELFRAARLVVDTGIHAKKWTREQAVEYLEKTTGYSNSTVSGEVDRYFVLPGQACSYKIGQLKILELRDRAQKALKEKFDIRKFHTAILKTGAVPLTILEEEIDKYIQNTLKSK